MNHFFVLVVYYTLFYKSKFWAMWLFKRLLCRRAEKNSELSQASKMELLQKIVKRFKYVNYFCNKLRLRCLIRFEYTSEEYSGNIQKTNLRQSFLQRCRQWDSNFDAIERKFEGKHYCNLPKMDASSDRFLKTFIKHQLKTTVIADRLDQNRYRLV